MLKERIVFILKPSDFIFTQKEHDTFFENSESTWIFFKSDKYKFGIFKLV